jgi:hypothetical protein
MRLTRSLFLFALPICLLATNLLILSGYMAYEYVDAKGYFASPTSSPTPTHTDTPSPTPSNTPSPTLTLTPTLTPTGTSTSTSTPIPTDTATATPTSSPTGTPTKKPPSVFIPWRRVDLDPYLQSLTTNSVTIAWQTEEKVIGEIRFGTSGDYGDSILEDEPKRRHAIKLTDLEPDEQYHYQVFGDGEPLTSDSTFRTAKPRGGGPYNFIVVGDTQKNPSVHASIIKQAISIAPSFFLHVGDLVNIGNSPDQWVQFFNIESDLLRSVALFPTLGNHEEESEHYFDLFYLPGNERWYTFTYGDARFISLQVDYDWPDVTPASKQYQWLESTLAGNKHPWLIIYFHRSPYTSEYEGSEELHIRENLTPLFEKYGVDLVLSGHNHNYQRSKANGIIYIVTGGGGGDLSNDIEPDEYLIYHKTAYHLLNIRIEGDRLRGEAMKPDGEVFDTFTISH